MFIHVPFCSSYSTGLMKNSFYRMLNQVLDGNLSILFILEFQIFTFGCLVTVPFSFIFHYFSSSPLLDPHIGFLRKELSKNNEYSSPPLVLTPRLNNFYASNLLQRCPLVLC